MSTLRKTGKIFTRDKLREKFKIYILKNFIHTDNIVWKPTDMDGLP